jgi:hypothetical protein
MWETWLDQWYGFHWDTGLTKTWQIWIWTRVNFNNTNNLHIVKNFIIICWFCKPIFSWHEWYLCILWAIAFYLLEWMVLFSIKQNVRNLTWPVIWFPLRHRTQLQVQVPMTCSLDIGLSNLERVIIFSWEDYSEY